jgi:hypothetical protein
MSHVRVAGESAINTTSGSMMPWTSMNGIARKKMRFSSLPVIFEDFETVESDWYTLAVNMGAGGSNCLGGYVAGF